MKVIKVSMDERLLAAADADPEVQRLGRSAVLRMALVDYLRRKRREEISAAYARAYAKPDCSLKSWTDEGVWPDVGRGEVLPAPRQVDSTRGPACWLGAG